MSAEQKLCYRCLTPWRDGEGALKKHPKLKDKVECCPKCGCWWRFSK